MSVARANWHVDQIAPLEGPDPFEAPVEEVGEAIDLADPAARLHLRLRELVNREARLDRMGISCPLKGKHGVVCNVCPVSNAGDDMSPLGNLCRVGREQELVCTELAVQGQHGARSDS